MQSVNFNFRPETSPDTQKTTLQNIQNWSEVSTAAHLRPDAKAPAVQRMAYAYVEEDAAVEKVIEKLHQLDAVEQASLPAERRLVAVVGTAEGSKP